ncbi:hypothetical protein V6Z12_D04G081400 [Gossypium hirsutum]
MIQETLVEGAFQAKFENLGGKNKKIEDNTSNNNNNETYHPCLHYKKTNHLPKKCWWRPDIKCRKCCIFGHIEWVCKSQQHEEVKSSIGKQKDEFLFTVTCFSSDSWLIDSDCTNHMTNDTRIFKELDKTTISEIKVGNGEFIPVKGKGTMAIKSLTGLKQIIDVLYLPNIDQNLFSVGKLIKKGFKVIFEDKWCLIEDSKSRDVFKAKMKAKRFALNRMEEKPTMKQLLETPQ